MCYGEEFSNSEVHDLMNAIHNIPQMLQASDGWYVPEKIDFDLQRLIRNGHSKQEVPELVFLRRLFVFVEETTKLILNNEQRATIGTIA